MQYRVLGKTGFSVSTVSFGAWAIGGSWGEVTEADAMAALHRALEVGINFFDTADVYGDGRSERLLARLRRESPREFRVATKAGRRLDPHVASGYTYENLRGFVERSLRNLETEALDLLQLHCPPPDAYSMPEVFDALDRLVADGKVQHYGVSVERVEEALRALEYPAVASVQIIYNLLRQRPAERFFAEAQRRGVGVLARVPLASGLLSGTMSATRTFAADDHRSFNREGQAFDRGETFAGVDLAVGLDVARELSAAVPSGGTLAQLALRWILMQEAVSCAIPGARSAAQVEQNAAAADWPPLPDETLALARRLYDERVRAQVHERW